MSKIFSYISLITSIAACVLSGAYYVHRHNSNLPIFPAVLLIVATFTMVIICTFNHYHTVMSPSEEDDVADENDVDNE